MGRPRIRTLIIYALELAIAASLLWYEQRLFFLWFFFSFLIAMDIKFRHLRRLISLYEIMNVVRTRTIFTKLGVSMEELNQVREACVNELTPQERTLLDELHSDFRV